LVSLVGLLSPFTLFLLEGAIVKLEKVTAEIRPRGRWESIDLGCALVRENYGKVMSVWFITVVPLWFCIIALSQFWPWAEGRPWIAGFVCLWILPLCDRIPLFVLSRRLFGEDSTTKELLKAIPKMFCRRFFITILMGPLNLARGLAQPVMELEGLKGKAYSQRVNLLSRNGGEGASQAALVSLVLVLGSMFSMLFVLFSVVGLFGDSIVIEEFWIEHVLDSDAVFMPVPYVWIILGLMLSAVTLVEPFYVGAGFAMYINSRTITEGWDIELAFKRMSERVSSVLQSTGKSLLITLAAFLCFSLSQTSVEGSNERLDKVMADDDFEIRSEIIQVPKIESSSSNSSGGLALFGALGVFSVIFFWVILIALIIGICWLIYSNMHVFKVTGRATSSSVPRVRSVMGMDVTPESLPEDIVAAARAAWDARDHQLALSYLYRGSISWVVNEMAIEIEEGDTENDCVQRVEQSGKDVESRYFSALTNHWVKLAYGKIEPDVHDFSSLCTSWPFTKVQATGEVNR
jgi:hypothetical protein